MTKGQQFSIFMDAVNYLKHHESSGYTPIYTYLKEKYGDNDKVYRYIEEKLLESGYVSHANYSQHHMSIKLQGIEASDSDWYEVFYGKENNGDKSPKTVIVYGDGNVITQDSSLDKVRLRPMVQNTTNNTPHNPPKRSVLEILAWIIGIIAGMVAIYEFVIKK